MTNPDDLQAEKDAKIAAEETKRRKAIKPRHKFEARRHKDNRHRNKATFLRLQEEV